MREIAKDFGADGVIYGMFEPDTSTSHSKRETEDGPSDRTSTGLANNHRSLRPAVSAAEPAVEATNNLRLTAKILSVIDDEIVGEKTMTMPVSAEMFTAVEEVSQTLGDNIKNLFFPSDKGALLRGTVLPGWGHMYKERQTWGYIWGGAFWSAVGFTALSTAMYARYVIEYKDHAPVYYKAPGGGISLRDKDAQAQFDDLVAKGDLWGQMTVIGLVSIGVVYVGNLLHAYFVKPDVVDNPAVMEQSGARLDFRLAPDRAGDWRTSAPPSAAMGNWTGVRGDVSLVWRF